MDESLLEKIKYLNGQLALNAFFIKSLEAEIERLREALKAIACINPSATNSSYVMRDSALAAFQQKDSE